jgi:hypothetical protein
MLKLVYLSLLQRILSVSGVADAVHIAVYYIGTILLEYQERAGHNGAGSGAYRQQGGSSSSHSHAGVGAPRQPAVIAPGPGSAVQQFWIPDELVGSSESMLSMLQAQWLRYMLGNDARSNRQGWDQDQRDPYAIPVSRPSDRSGHACYSWRGRQPGREVDHHQRTSYQFEHGCGHVACGESSRSRPVPHEQFGKEKMILADMVGIVY